MEAIDSAEGRVPLKSVSPRMTDEAVLAKTGRKWNEWFATLDQAGANQMTHAEIARMLHAKFDVPSWWSQMVTVTYEQARGLREKHQRPDGYEISVSRTIAAPAAKVYDAWEKPKTRARWLADPGFTVRKATPAKTLRITWVDGKSSVEVRFVPTGGAKTQVTAQHSKLAGAAAARRMKKYWAESLDRLKSTLE